jgi:hypothetical protein
LYVPIVRMINPAPAMVKPQNMMQYLVRRPRTDGFLAGRFYAATAGAFSASYASGER